MEYEQVGQKAPILLGEELHQLLLDLDRIRLMAQAKQPGQAGDVGVDRNPFVGSVRVAEHDIGSLAPYAWQLPKLLHSAGHFTPMISHQRPGHSDEALGFVPEEAGGFDDLLYVSGFSPGQIKWGGVPRKQHRSDQVDPRIGTLGRQDRSTKKLVRVLVLQGATSIGVGLLEERDYVSGGRAEERTGGLSGLSAASLGQGFLDD
jgi:hypothetical protein